MHRLRLALAARPLAALWLVACVLAVRLLVPAGYMPVAGPGGIALGLCPGTMDAAPAAHAAMPGMHHGGEERREEPPAAPSMPCTFAAAGLAAIDVPPVVLAAPVAPAAIATAAARLVAPPVFTAVRWRPPLRAPPLG